MGVSASYVVSSTTELRRTPLYDRHAAAGAKLVPFAGWEMPVQYAGIREEHLAVRTGAGVFDVSHMGQIETTGPQALEFLQHMVSNDVRRVPEGGAQYSVMCNPDGCVLDDLFSYRLSDNTFLTVTNAANHDKDLAWMQGHAGEFDVDVIDRHGDFAMLAVQGPEACALVRGLTDGNLPARFHVCERTVAGAAMLVCGTGYTGEDGVELLLRPDDALSVWDAVTAGRRHPDRSRRARHTAPRGLLSPVRQRPQRGSGSDRSRASGGPAGRQRGSSAPRRLRPPARDGTEEKLVPFVIDGQGIARQGNAVVGGGEVTSGTFSPCLERGIGMAYVSSARAAEGTQIEIDVRGRVRPAVIERKPLYRKEA